MKIKYLKRTLQQTLKPDIETGIPWLSKPIIKGTVLNVLELPKTNSFAGQLYEVSYESLKEYLKDKDTAVYYLERKYFAVDKRKQGKRNKLAGAAWELKVREDLEDKGWFVAKFHNNVDLEIGTMYPAKHKFNFFTKVMSLGSGFPDLIAWRPAEMIYTLYQPEYEVIGVECKLNGYIDPEEKKKCIWLIKQKVFSKILIAKKIQSGRKMIPNYTAIEKGAF